MKMVFSETGPLDWAKNASPAHERSGFKGSAWEDAIVGLVAAGDSRFFEILRNHIQSGVIRSERATKVLNAAIQGTA